MTEDHGQAIAALRAQIAELESRLARVETQTGIARTPSAPYREPVPHPPAAPFHPPVAPPPPPPTAPPPQWQQAQSPHPGQAVLPNLPQPAGPIPGLGQASASTRTSSGGAAVAAEDLESRMGLQWVNRIGALTLILAAIFVFKYAADSGWLGPGLRVSLGLLAGLTTLAAAEWLWRRSHLVVAQGVAGLGSALLYLSLYAAYDWYSLLPRILTFGMLGLVAMATGALALRFNSQALALLAGLGALLAPPIVSTGSSQIWALNGYLLLVAGLSVLLSRLKPWPAQAWFVYLGVKIMYWASVFDDGGTSAGNPTLVFALAYYALYLFFPGISIVALAQVTLSVGMVLSHSYNEFDPWSWHLVASALIGIAVAEWRRNAITAAVALVTVHATVLLALQLKLEIYSPEFEPLAAVAVVVITSIWAIFTVWIPWGWLRRDDAQAAIATVLFAVNGVAAASATALLFQINRWEHTALVLFALGGIYWSMAALPAGIAPFGRLTSLRDASQALGVLLVIWAIPLQFDGLAATGLWALVGAALAWGSSREHRWWLDAGAILMFGLAWLRFLAVDVASLSGGEETSLAATFLGGLLCACAAFGSAWLWKGRELSWVVYIAGHLFLLSTLVHQNWEMGKALAAGGEQMLWQSAGLSVLFSIYGAVLVAGGIFARSRPNRLAGLLMLLFVVLKLYLYDIWMLDTLFRILAFGALGSMLLATSFLYSRLKQTMKRLVASEDTGEGAASQPAPPTPPPPEGASW